MDSIPEKLINFRVYENGTNDLLGLVDAELPNIEPMSDTIKGAGIAGEVDAPVLGHFKSMSLKLSWRTITKPLINLTQQKVHALDLRGAIQHYDAALGEFKVVPVKVVVRCTPKKTGLGKLEVGKGPDSSNEFEIVYIKVVVANTVTCEIDKYNYICNIGGVDYLAAVREALGLN